MWLWGGSVRQFIEVSWEICRTVSDIIKHSYLKEKDRVGSFILGGLEKTGLT
jgi:hypothetical protein